jgi:maleylpyruvate isomerase
MSDVARPRLELITHADQALIRTVDALDDDAYAEPSLLPDWTKGHVIAHLALNAEGLERVLTGVHVGEPRTMYDSDDARNEDIAELAVAAPSELRERLLGGVTQFSRAVEAMNNDDWAARFDRTPGGPSFAVNNIPLMRVREVEIHHADLGAGYTASDWSEEFRTLLLESMTKRDYPGLFIASATDLDRTWQYGDGVGGDVISGDSASLGWWLTGRGSGEGLTSVSGALPRIDSW